MTSTRPQPRGQIVDENEIKHELGAVGNIKRDNIAIASTPPKCKKLKISDSERSMDGAPLGDLFDGELINKATINT